MMQTPKNWDLKKLLDVCKNKHNSSYETGWREFISRYRRPLYGHVLYSCRAWRVARLNRQLSATVDDIMAEVFQLLMQSIGGFRAVDKPQMFHSWLAIIAYRTTGRYMQRFYMREMIDGDIHELPEIKSQWDPLYRQTLYEYVVDILRSAKASLKGNRERDIHLFMLSVWSDFSLKMLQRHPAFPELDSPYAAKSAIKRIRQELKRIKL